MTVPPPLTAKDDIPHLLSTVINNSFASRKSMGGAAIYFNRFSSGHGCFLSVGIVTITSASARLCATAAPMPGEAPITRMTFHLMFSWRGRIIAAQAGMVIIKQFPSVSE
ncbi:hypothetical protein [Mucilaginibacter pineti]|uniref:hypothetical protein n=1 Tax=Mucilaginibacter pineti TaxID=1391627 RepID=UPI00116005DB|nr:hypothetical protein [Mucilaginibacter pineti]